MRAYLTAILCCAATPATGCAREEDALDAAVTPAPAPAPAASAGVSGAGPASLVLACAPPFTREATPTTLAAVFGRENVIPETVAGPEGAQINVTAIYPNDPARRIEIIFRNEEERTDLSAVMISAPESQWTGPGGIGMGDTIADVQSANGGVFNVMGFQWDYGGFVSDWRGGRLDDVDGCRTTVRLSPAGEDLPGDIVGDGVEPASDLPAMRAAQPRVSSFGIGWAPAT
jgi:hypothetical protein